VKRFEDRLIFGEVMDKSLVSCFLTHSVLLTSRDARQTSFRTCVIVTDGSDMSAIHAPDRNCPWSRLKVRQFGTRLENLEGMGGN